MAQADDPLNLIRIASAEGVALKVDRGETTCLDDNSSRLELVEIGSMPIEIQRAEKAEKISP